MFLTENYHEMKLKLVQLHLNVMKHEFVFPNSQKNVRLLD